MRFWGWKGLRSALELSVGFSGHSSNLLGYS